jgi:hypothetical protein
MEGSPQIQVASPTPITDNTSSQNDNLILIVLGVVGMYLIFRKKDKKNIDKKSEDGSINSYEDFSGTNLGNSVNRQLKSSYVQLSQDQINDLNTCFGGLTDKERRVFTRACNYTSRESLVRGIGRKNMKVFLPIRQRIINCFQDQNVNVM